MCSLLSLTNLKKKDFKIKKKVKFASSSIEQLVTVVELKKKGANSSSEFRILIKINVYEI